MYAAAAEQKRNRWADRCYESASLLPPDFDWAPPRAIGRVFDVTTVAANLCHALNEIDPGDGSLTPARVEAILRNPRLASLEAVAGHCAKACGACGVAKHWPAKDARNAFKAAVRKVKDGRPKG